MQHLMQDEAITWTTRTWVSGLGNGCKQDNRRLWNPWIVQFRPLQLLLQGNN